MKLRVLMVAMVLAVLFMSGNLYAANGDLIVNGNLGVGTTTPAGKAEINGNMIVGGNVKAGTATVTDKAEVTGNMIVNGNLGVGTGTAAPTEKAEIKGNMKVDGTITSGGQTVNGNLCVGGSCTSTLHVSGGLYGYCLTSNVPANYPCTTVLAPMTCPRTPPQNAYLCACPSGYTMVSLNGVYYAGMISSCYKQ